MVLCTFSLTFEFWPRLCCCSDTDAVVTLCLQLHRPAADGKTEKTKHLFFIFFYIYLYFLWCKCWKHFHPHTNQAQRTQYNTMGGVHRLQQQFSLQTGQWYFSNIYLDDFATIYFSLSSKHILISLSTRPQLMQENESDSEVNQGDGRKKEKKLITYEGWKVSLIYSCLWFNQKPRRHNNVK